MKRILTLALLFASLAAPAQKKPELARSPMMGWNSWNIFERVVTEDDVIGIIDAMDSLGMQRLGYEYIVVDGGWRKDTLNADGSLSAHPEKFPHGIKYLSDYAHSKGFKFGLHTVPGRYDCGCHPVGGWGHEALQIAQFVSWDLDFLKLDRCRLTLDKAQRGWTPELTEQTFRMWSKMIHECGRDITLSFSIYAYYPWYPELCNMGRTTGDISHKASRGAFFETSEKNKRPCNAVMAVADLNNEWADKAGSGYWNDPDMLPLGEQGLTDGEQRAMFSLWCIMSSPLMLGNDPRRMSDFEWATISNKNALMIDQDSTEQGRRIWSSAPAGISDNGAVKSAEGAREIWRKHLSDGRQAILLLNRSKEPATIALDPSQLGFRKFKSIYNVYEGVFCDKGLREFSIPARSSQLLVVTGK